MKDRPGIYLRSSVSRVWLAESRGRLEGLRVPIVERENTGEEAGFEKGAYLYSKVMSC